MHVWPTKFADAHALYAGCSARHSLIDAKAIEMTSTALLACAAASAAARSREAADEAFRSGVRAHIADRLPEAVSLYRTALQHDPSNFQVLNNLGGAHLKLELDGGEQQRERRSQRLREAEQSLVAAVRLAPTFYDARLNLGMLRRHQGRLTEALSASSPSCNLCTSACPRSTNDATGCTPLSKPQP